MAGHRPPSRTVTHGRLCAGAGGQRAPVACPWLIVLRPATGSSSCTDQILPQNFMAAAALRRA